MTQSGALVTGIDMATASIQVAKLHALDSGLPIDYRHCTAEQLAQQESEQFDVVTCMEMIEHVPDPDSVIQACSQLLKPGGWFIASTLNRTWRSYLLGIVAAEKLLKWLPEGTHEHSKFKRPSELLAITDRHGLQARAIKGFRYHPIGDSFSLADDISVNYIVACQKPELI